MNLAKVAYRYRRHIHCSAEIVGITLGVAGVPPFQKCHKGSHFNGECPSFWGSAGFPLPGFDAAGDRIDSECNVPLNEPIRKTIRMGGISEGTKDIPIFSTRRRSRRRT
jgi:hypothetical protein